MSNKLSEIILPPCPFPQWGRHILNNKKQTKMAALKFVFVFFYSFSKHEKEIIVFNTDQRLPKCQRHTFVGVARRRNGNLTPPPPLKRRTV